MKKSSMIASGIVLTALVGGYGAWCLYKKVNPNGASKVKKDMKKVTKNMEKSIEDMM